MGLVEDLARAYPVKSLRALRNIVTLSGNDRAMAEAVVKVALELPVTPDEMHQYTLYLRRAIGVPDENKSLPPITAEPNNLRWRRDGKPRGSIT